MLFATIIRLIAVLLAFLSQTKPKGKFLEFGFILLTFFASIQYGFGSDYHRYYELWYQYSTYDIGLFVEDFFNQTDWTEPGWILLNAIFGFKYGFFVLVALISVVENYIYYRLIKDYVPVKWRWLAMFLYVSMDSLYWLNYSMFRQGLCVALFVGAVLLMNRNKLWSAIALMLFSLTIHLSSAVCIPFIALYFLPLNKTKTLASFLLVFTILIFLFKDIVIGGLNLVFTLEELGKYKDSGYGASKLGGLGLGYLLNHIPNFVILYFLIKDQYIKSREKKVIALLAFCDILIAPLQLYGAAFAGRLGVYFVAFKVASIPMVYSMIKDKGLRLFLVLIVLFSTLVMFIQFFQIYLEGYSEGFKTIFSVI